MTTIDLKALGLHKRYKPYTESETGTLLIKTRHPDRIVDGRLKDSEIALYGKNTFLVWTPQVKKANRIAKAHGIKVRLLTGEAELHVPVSLADAILPLFGAVIRREMSEEQRQACSSRLAAFRLRSKPHKNALPAMEQPKVASQPKQPI